MSGFAAIGTRRPEPTGLPRPRLLTPLVSDRGPGVVVVIAPPGSGKTTLLARAAALTPRAAGWCLAGPEDRSARTFLDHVCRVAGQALDRDLGAPGTAAQLARRPGVRPGPPLLLVLDDVHELAGLGRRGRAGRRWCAAARPTSGSRSAPAARSRCNTPRLMVSGELVELDSEALRFRSWEVEELFRLVYREPLSPEAAAALTRRTGGWAAGLMLFHLSTSGEVGGRAGAGSGRPGRAVPAAAQLPDPHRPGRARPRAPRVPAHHLHPGHADRAAVRRTAATGGQRRGCWRTSPRASSSPRWPRTVARTATTRSCRPCSRACSSTSCGPRAAAELYAASARLLEADGPAREASARLRDGRRLRVGGAGAAAVRRGARGGPAG